MRPLSWIGVLLIIAGIVVVAMRGVPYTKSRNEVEVVLSAEGAFDLTDEVLNQLRR